MKTLVAITTRNQLEYTKRAVESLKGAPVEILIVDDGSVDGTIEWARENNIPHIQKRLPRGLTHSWNIAYGTFKGLNFDVLFIANNDIIVPKGAMEKLIGAVKPEHTICPISNPNGVGNLPVHCADKYFNFGFDIENPDNVQRVQDFVMKSKIDNFKPKTKEFAGYFFGFDRSVFNNEIVENTLIPFSCYDNTNINNEWTISERFSHQIVVCPQSFIYHYKEITIPDNGSDRNCLNNVRGVPNG